MTLRRVARPRLLDSHCLLENSRGCFREIALFPILLFFRFALRFGHVESCHRSTLREILKFKLTHYPGDHRRARAARISRSSRPGNRRMAARLSSLTNRRYYFELTTTPNVIWMDLAKFDLKAGAPVMILDPDNIDLAGNVSAKFQKTSKVPF